MQQLRNSNKEISKDFAKSAIRHATGYAGIFLDNVKDLSFDEVCQDLLSGDSDKHAILREIGLWLGENADQKISKDLAGKSVIYALQDKK